MKSKKIKTKTSRVLLSDVLPYELPIIFSNRHFLHVVEKYIKEHPFKRPIVFSKNAPMLLQTFLNNNTSSTIPFTYKIKHNDLNSRDLTIIHPIEQLNIIKFYEKYKELILYLCNKSHFSIRKPIAIAKHYYYKDNLHKKTVSDEDSCIEQYNQEYESLKSFFVYKKYNNIYKFYDSYLFNRCEKKYNFLLKLDISKCFNSIYTHSLSWATYGKTFSKNNLHPNKLKGSFSDNFDILMQSINYHETNGIVIGPEFSRIFAEIILQKIDLDLENSLNDRNLYHKINYEIYRYVDDYFIFYNDDTAKELIISNLSELLSFYKLSLNEKKMVIYNKPIITNISKAKKRIKALLKENITWNIIKDEAGNKKIKTNIKVLSLISNFKIIISDTNVEYKDILNQTFAIIDNKLFKFFKDINNMKPDDITQAEEKIYEFVSALLEFINFIYSVYPKVSTTIRLSNILKRIIYFYKRKHANKNFKFAIFDIIYSNIILILKKNKLDKYSYIETSYLLIILRELGKNYYLSKDFLSEYFSIGKKGKKQYPLNYLSIMTLLFYIQNKLIYNDIKNYIIRLIEDRLSPKHFNKISCEDILMLFDTISCPYIRPDQKHKILENLGCPQTTIKKILKHNKNWFISWGKDFNLKKALNAKKSNEVY